MLRLAGNDPDSVVPGQSLCGTSRPGMGRDGHGLAPTQVLRVMHFNCNCFPVPGLSPGRAHSCGRGLLGLPVELGPG
jgi:hypothetical protein